MSYTIEEYLGIRGDNLHQFAHKLFMVLGGGTNFNSSGYVISKGISFKHQQKPEGFSSWVYPYHENWKKLKGCVNEGFKDFVLYFIECIEATDDSVENIKEWKDNLNQIRDILLSDEEVYKTYTLDDYEEFIKDVEEEKKTHQHPADGTVIEKRNSVSKEWFFDVQWSDAPVSVEAEISDLWRDMEFGNDHYIYKTNLDEELFEHCPKTYFWLKSKGVPLGDKVFIHWWW